MNTGHELKGVLGKERITKPKLYSLRMSKNKTQKQLAEYAGITTRYYQYLETGRKKPTIQIALKLAEALDATAEEVFTIEL